MSLLFMQMYVVDTRNILWMFGIFHRKYFSFSSLNERRPDMQNHVVYTLLTHTRTVLHQVFKRLKTKIFLILNY